MEKKYIKPEIRTVKSEGESILVSSDKPALKGIRFSANPAGDGLTGE